MFKRVFSPTKEPITVTVEGQEVTVAQGDSAAVAVLNAGFKHTRLSAINGQPRGPYCLMGVCFDCLVEIDGQPNQQACQTQVREGMRILLQNGIRDL